MKRLSGMDAMFLHTETRTQYMHTLKIAIFDAAGDKQSGGPCRRVARDQVLDGARALASPRNSMVKQSHSSNVQRSA